MEINGLDITEDQFMSLRLKEQNLMLFRNVRVVRGNFKNYSFHRKIQYVWLIVLTITVGLKRLLTS